MEHIDLMRVVTRIPADAAEKQASIDAALAMYAGNPADTINALNSTACRFEHLTPLFFELWGVFNSNAQALRMNRYWPNAWVDACIDVWSDPRFMDYVEDADFVDCWREVASPEFCQPEGGELRA